MTDHETKQLADAVLIHAAVRALSAGSARQSITPEAVASWVARVEGELRKERRSRSRA